MNKLINYIGLAVLFISIIFLLQSCGEKLSSNEYLGELPGIAQKYSQKIDETKKELKESRDMNEAFGLQKDLNGLKDEAENAIKEYIANNQLNAIPFEQKTEYPFTIGEIKVDPKNKSISSLRLVTQVKFNKNLTAEEIRNTFGGFGSNINAYVHVMDSKGTLIHRTVFTLNIPYSQDEYRAKEGSEYAMSGLIYPLNKLENFGKLIFISQDEFNKKI